MQPGSFATYFDTLNVTLLGSDPIRKNFFLILNGWGSTYNDNEKLEGKQYL